MSPINTLALILFVCAAVFRVEAFTSPSTARTTAPSSALPAGRRDFLDAAMSTTAGFVIASIPAMAGAEEEAISDDLAMPSEEDTKKADEAAMAERLRRKAELQQSKARPLTFQDRYAKEKQKQKSMEMTKEQRRDELCETLGRGC